MHACDVLLAGVSMALALVAQTQLDELDTECIALI